MREAGVSQELSILKRKKYKKVKEVKEVVIIRVINKKEIEFFLSLRLSKKSTLKVGFFDKLKEKGKAPVLKSRFKTGYRGNTEHRYPCSKRPLTAVY